VPIVLKSGILDLLEQTLLHYPFKDEWQIALFKDRVRTAL
jgi:hypothetical protein